MSSYLSDIENDNHLNDSLLGINIGNNIIDNPFFLVPVIPFLEEYQDYKEIPIYSISNLNENHSEDTIINSSIIESSNPIIELSNGDNSSIKFYSFDKIKEIFQNSDFHEKLKKNIIIEEDEQKLCSKKRKRNKTSQGAQDKKNENEKRTKRGRKNKNKNGQKEHTKMGADNIIKKIKSKIFKYSMGFINKMIKNKEEKSLCRLNYKKYIDNIVKEKDLDYLNMKLKDLLSLEISPKQKFLDKDFNKNLIDQIINKEILVQDYNTTIFALNMKLKDWLELFLMKQNINDLKNKYRLEETNDVNFDTIEKYKGKVNDLYRELLKGNDEQYFSLSFLYLYNYERYFYMKRIRKTKDIDIKTIETI